MRRASSALSVAGSDNPDREREYDPADPIPEEAQEIVEEVSPPSPEGSLYPEDDPDDDPAEARVSVSGGRGPFPNPIDTPELRAAAFMSDGMFRPSFLLLWDVYTEATPVLQRNLISLISYAEAYRKKAENPDVAAVVTGAGHVLVPRLDAMERADVPAYLLALAKSLWENARNCPVLRLRNEDWVRFIAPDGPAHAIHQRLPAEMTAPWDVTMHDADGFFRLLADHAMSDVGTRFAATIYITSYLAIAKRGSITTRKFDKIIGELTTSLGYPPEIPIEALQMIYTGAQTVMKDEDYRPAFEKWRGDIAPYSLRLRITLQQAAGGGLTALATIKKAQEEFPDFPWANLKPLLRTEHDAVISACAAVGSDEYYGFRRDLGVAASSRYRSYTYVAHSLLVKYGGPDGATLRGYKGVTKTPVHKEQLDGLVAEYEATIAAREQAAMPDAAAANEFMSEMRQAIAAATGLVG